MIGNTYSQGSQDGPPSLPGAKLGGGAAQPPEPSASPSRTSESPSPGVGGRPRPRPTHEPGGLARAPSRGWAGSSPAVHAWGRAVSSSRAAEPPPRGLVDLGRLAAQGGAPPTPCEPLGPLSGQVPSPPRRTPTGAAAARPRSGGALEGGQRWPPRHRDGSTPRRRRPGGSADCPWTPPPGRAQTSLSGGPGGGCPGGHRRWPAGAAALCPRPVPGLRYAAPAARSPLPGRAV